MENLIDLKKLAKKYDLDLLILFGSRVSGKINKFSDYDFAYFKFVEDKDLYNNLYNDLIKVLNVENIDLINLKEDLDPYFIYQVLKNSKLIYEKEKGFYDELFSNSVINYIKFKPYLELEEEIIEKRLES